MRSSLYHMCGQFFQCTMCAILISVPWAVCVQWQLCTVSSVSIVCVELCMWAVCCELVVMSCACEKCAVSNVSCTCVLWSSMGRRAVSASAPSAVTAAAPFLHLHHLYWRHWQQPSQWIAPPQIPLHFLPTLIICQLICTDGMLAFATFLSPCPTIYLLDEDGQCKG